MSTYEMFFILTMPLYLMAIYKINRSFLGEALYSKKTEIGCYILYAIGVCTICMTKSIPIVLLVFNLLSFWGMTFNYYSTKWNRIRYACSLYLLLFIIEMAVTGLTGYLNIKAFEESQYQSIIGITLARTLMLMGAYLIHKYKIVKVKKFPVPGYYYIAYSFSLLGTLYLFLIALEKDSLSMAQVIVSSIVVLGINGIILVIDEKIYSIIILNNEKNFLKQQNIAYENQVEMINQSTAAIRALKHDMKNHIVMLKSIQKNNIDEVFQHYTDQIISEIDGDKAYAHSNNFIVDSIINYKLQELKSLEVDIKLDMNIPEHLNILAFDLVTILGNLLDNAIRALRQSKKDKKLSIYIQCTKGSLIILIDNTYSEKITVRGGRLQTSKGHKENHGMGIQNVRDIVSRYQGEMEIDYTKEVFSIAIVIPGI